MFQIRDEGEIIKHGFNFYPLHSNQVGFLLCYGEKDPFYGRGTKIFQLRYNKKLSKCLIGWFDLAVSNIS
jgi:hypothetical protein